MTRDIWQRPTRLIPLDRPLSDDEREAAAAFLAGRMTYPERRDALAAACRSLLEAHDGPPKTDTKEADASTYLTAHRALATARKAGDLDRVEEAAAWLGELTERLQWRWGIVPGTRRSPEELALERRQTFTGTRGERGITAERRAFLQRVAEEFGTSNRQAIALRAVKKHRAEVRRLWRAEGAKAEAKILNFMRNSKGLDFDN